ncbi:hypothetical protein [Vibrio litoralis]|uniref:hypothetical protein n=1 Tax=Vibrio litoralis TaxID=335972 RepID=UPI0003F7BE29|nr:hypothetical protein [Vibrio litoralis]
MTTQLFDKNNKPVPPRPSMSDESVKKLVIQNAVESLFSGKWCPFDEGERDDLLSTLLDKYSHHDDEYELAKKFENDGWDVDRDFVSNLECVTGEINSEFSKSIKAWFDAYQPLAPLEMGAVIEVRGFHGKEKGTIDSIYEYGPATYTVKMEDQEESNTSRRLIKFEDAVLAS